MPFVDSVSGAFHDELPIGQIYRLVLFFYMLTLLMTVSKRTFINVLFPFIVFLLIQSIVSSNYIKDSLQGVIKLFTPIFLDSLIQTLQKKKIYKFDIYKDGNVKYSAKTKIKGKTINQYSLDEKDNHLRIALYNNKGSRVAIFDEKLKQIGISNYVAKGETMYSSRFI